MGNQLLATFMFFGHPNINIYGCWDKETKEGEFDFFDLYDATTGVCLNEGEPFDTFPTWREVLDYLDTIKKK